MEYKYNYVVFNTIRNQYNIPDKDNYYSICVAEFEDSESVQLVSLPMQDQPFFIRYLHALHNSERLSQYINLPLKNLWYPLFFKNKFKNDKPLCFVLLNHKLHVSYLKYLKKKYPSCKIVLMHRDFLKISQACNPELPMNPILDLEMTYDEGESIKYGFPHFSEFESKVEIPIEKDFESDVFFAGKAKDRLPALLEAYKILTRSGFKPYFFLTGVPVEQQQMLPGIEYASRFMSYREMLYHTVNTRCLLEAVQGGGQSGFTSRFLEAVILGSSCLTEPEQRFLGFLYFAPSSVMLSFIFSNCS